MEQAVTTMVANVEAVSLACIGRSLDVATRALTDTVRDVLLDQIHDTIEVDMVMESIKTHLSDMMSVVHPKNMH